MVVDAVVGQPTYGTLPSQIFADGREQELRNYQRWLKVLPGFLQLVNLL